jgi:Transcriptional regulatory protein, C terminal
MPDLLEVRPRNEDLPQSRDRGPRAERSSKNGNQSSGTGRDEPSRPLEGEDIETSHWEDAHRWIGIYADLLEFKRGLLDRVERDLTRLSPVARAAAGRDLQIIRLQMEGYQERLELWYRRVWDLHGLRLDPERRTIHYGAETAILTTREFQLLQFLLDRPNRYYSVTQILAEAWTQPGLLPEELRTYVRHLRKVLATLGVPGDLVNVPRRGYSLRFREA